MTTTATLSDELKTYLDESKAFATVATVNAAGQPHQTVVWCRRDGEDILFSTTAERLQGRNLAANPKVAVLIGSPDNPYSYSEVRGTATITEDPDSVLGDQLARKYTGLSWEEFSKTASVAGTRITVRVTPERVVGR